MHFIQSVLFCVGFLTALHRNPFSIHVENFAFPQHFVKCLPLLGLKKPMVPVPDRPYFFSADPIIFSMQSKSGWLRAAHSACQNRVCCWTKLPKFVHRKYISIVNIDVGSLLKIAQQKTSKTMKKYFLNNLFPTYQPQIFHDMTPGPQVSF
jgi:hypothetical protein